MFVFCDVMSCDMRAGVKPSATITFVQCLLIFYVSLCGRAVLFDSLLRFFLVIELVVSVTPPLFAAI